MYLGHCDGASGLQQPHARTQCNTTDEEKPFAWPDERNRVKERGRRDWLGLRNRWTESQCATGPLPVRLLLLLRFLDAPAKGRERPDGRTKASGVPLKNGGWLFRGEDERGVRDDFFKSL